MYRSYFGLEKNPFAITPDPMFLYLSRRHKEALAHLLFGMSGEGGFVQLTGEVGTGKTTLCRCMVEQAPKEVDVALILNPRQTAVELVVSICEELRIELPRDAGSLKLLIDRLNSHLLSTYSRGRRTVLIIDEAQNLSADTLEQVRLLTNLETNTRKLMQIHLIGQPELKKLLARPELRQLAQRITARYHLGPLSSYETAGYIRYRLKIAGRERPIFTQGALRLVHQLSGGTPRIVNMICDRALLGAYGRQSDRVDRRLVARAYSEVMGKSRGLSLPRWAYWTALGLALIALGFSSMTTPWLHPDRLYAIVNRITKSYVLSRPWPEREKPRIDLLASRAGEEANSNQNINASVSQIPLSRTIGVRVRISKNERDEELKLSRLLRANLLKTDEETAFATVFKYWHLTYSEFGGETACQRAFNANLHCFSAKGNWGKLRQLNRPVILKLVENGNLHHVALVGLSKRIVTLGFLDREVRLPYEEIDPYWLGEFILLWRPPPLSTGLIMKGISGPDVIWLRGQLGRLDGHAEAFDDAADKNLFDEELEKQVKKFQRSQNIQMDGRVGEETLVHLTKLGVDPSLPALWQEDTDSEGEKPCPSSLMP